MVKTAVKPKYYLLKLINPVSLPVHISQQSQNDSKLCTLQLPFVVVVAIIVILFANNEKGKKITHKQHET